MNAEASSVHGLRERADGQSATHVAGDSVYRPGESPLEGRRFAETWHWHAGKWSRSRSSERKEEEIRLLRHIAQGRTGLNVRHECLTLLLSSGAPREGNVVGETGCSEQAL